jgi:carbonic anhydrase
MPHPDAPIPDSTSALRALLEGNARYVEAKLTHPDQTAARRAELVGEQHPFAVIFGCSDSRVPAEIVFDQGLGDLFVVRVAGPVLDDAVLGSLEFAALELRVPLILVLGHERCGAVTAALDVLDKGTTPPGHISHLVDAISPAVKRVRGRPGDVLDNAVRANIELVVEKLRTSRQVLANQVSSGKLRIVGARYDLDRGRVDVTVP